MEFWLIYKREDAKKNSAYIDCYKQLAPKYGMSCRLVYTDELFIGVKDGQPFVEGPSLNPLFAIVRTINPDLSYHLEKCGIRCLNSAFVSNICNNKASTYRYLAGRGIPMPDSEFVKGSELAEYLKNCEKGRIIKAVAGHGGSQVYMYDGCAEKVLETMQGSDVVVQDRIGSKARDLRVYVLGNEILACVLRSSDSNFRANFSLGGEVRLYDLNESEKTLVNRIISLFEFNLVGIDFLLDDDGNLIFNEIEDVVGARMLYKCSDIDIVDEYLNYISQKILPAINA